jgi:hypothetical protein
MTNNHQSDLKKLASAISDVGGWSYWQGKLPDLLQLEFTGVQLWNPPEDEDRPPSGTIALQFKNVQAVDFLTFVADSVPANWPELIASEQLCLADRVMIVFNDVAAIKTELASVKRFDAVCGLGYKRDDHFFDSQFQCVVQTGGIGVVVSAELLIWRNHTEKDLPLSLIEERSIKWWEYHQAYWKSKETNQPFPRDTACEVTIPIR